jgi:hypothetical protein
MGDSTTALGTGLLLRDSEVSIIDTEISGARNVAIDVAGASRIHIMASDVHDNPGAALAVRSGASARVVHNVFRRNGVSPQTAAPIILGENADLKLASNMFYDLTPAAFRALGESDRDAIARDNWFSASHPSRTAAPARPRGAGQQPGRPGPAVP